MFSYYGKLSIDDSVLKDIIYQVMKRQEGVVKASDVTVKHRFEGDEDSGIDIYAALTVPYGMDLRHVAENAREYAQKDIEWMTGMIVHRFEVVVKRIVVTESKKRGK